MKAIAFEGLEKFFDAERKKFLAELVELEKSYARKELVSGEYSMLRKNLENAVVSLGYAAASLAAIREIDGLAAEHSADIVSQSKRQRLAELLGAKAKMQSVVSSLKGHIKKGWPSKEAFNEIKEAHSVLLDTESHILQLAKDNSLDLLKREHILGKLESDLHRNELSEMTNRAALRAIDEFVIDVPKHIAAEMEMHENLGGLPKGKLPGHEAKFEKKKRVQNDFEGRK